MIDYEKTIQNIIDTLTNITFEFDFETVKKEMELQEIPKSELDKLGENKIQEKFNEGVFKIKMPNGNLIDSNSIYKHSIKNNIKEPVLFINPNFKYVQWVVKKDFVRPQIKKQIKNQLTNNTDINLVKVQNALMIEDIKNKKIVGFINKLPIKTSNYISEGKFFIQSSFSRESAIEMITEVIEELKTDTKKYIENKFKSDYKNIFFYFLFIFFVTSLWYVNKQYQTLPIWISNTFAIILFLIPLVIMRLINHSFFDTLLSRKKAKKKYEKEFYNIIS